MTSSPFSALLLSAFLSLSAASGATAQSNARVKPRAAAPGATKLATPAIKRIVFFGNSLTAGYGVPATANYPALLAQKIDSAGLNYTVVNAGISGETSGGGLRRVGTVLRQPVDVFVLELGANDVFRGVPVAQIRRNLQGIIDAVKARYPRARIVVAGLQVPGLSGGTGYVGEFSRLFSELAARNKAAFIPYLLEGVGGIQELNLPDGIHPTAAGYRIVAGTVWRTLAPVLQVPAAAGKALP